MGLKKNIDNAKEKIVKKAKSSSSKNSINYKDLENSITNIVKKVLNKELNANVNNYEKVLPNQSDENKSNVEKKIVPRISADYMKDFIVFENVTKEYKSGDVTTVALSDASFSIDEGEFVIFLGQSGAGKSTALNLLGGMNGATSGRIVVGDKEITNYSFDELTNYRRDDIGFIFQFYNLIPNLSIKENIELTTEIADDFIDPSLILEKVGLEEYVDKFPSQLSGGEQQRVAIARAIAKKPKLLLCDEPTGSLDYKTGKKVLKLIQETCRRNNVTTVVITHNAAVAPMADKVIYFKSGKVVDVKINKEPEDVEGIEW